MAHTIKVSGVSPELLSRVDERWRERHFADRSEYVRELIRRDVLAGEGAPRTLSESVRAIFGAVHEEVARRGYTDEEIAADVAGALAEVRAERPDRKSERAA